MKVSRIMTFLLLAGLLFSCHEQKSNPYANIQLEAFTKWGKSDYALDETAIRSSLIGMVRADKDSTAADVRTRGYYQNGGRFLWISKLGVNVCADTLVAYVEDLCQVGFPETCFRLDELKSDLRRVRSLDTGTDGLNQLMARVEYNLTKVWLRYTFGQQYGFSDPRQLLNRMDIRDSDSLHVSYRTLFDLPVRRPGRYWAQASLHKITSDSVVEYLHEVQPRDPLYPRLKEAWHNNGATDAFRRRCLLVNMERCRWRQPSYPGDGKKYVVVNIPSFHLRAVSPDSVVEMRVGCGTLATKTPLLTSAIMRMDVNPQWVMPRSIVEKDVVRHLGDVDWFYRHRYFVRERKTGRRVQPEDITGEMLYDGKHYAVVQEGGRGNSLGRIIFRFDNNFSVYLHDTSTRGFFGRENRGVSHGCVRVERPYELALFLLGNRAADRADDLLYNMTADSIADQSRRIGSIKVEPQVPLFITYYTAWPSLSGVLQYLPDVYGYDERIYKYLSDYYFHAI